MQLLLQLGQIFLYTYMAALVSPILWIVIFLVYLQYKRAAAMEQRFFGRVINPIKKQMISSLGLGLLAGFLASLVLILLGLSLEQIGLYFIWPVALVMLFINPRYLCFSYAGGIVALTAILFRSIVVPLIPAVAANPLVEALLKIHIPALLGLIGLLHFMEALLIYIGGHRGCSPLYYKHPQGDVVGGFSLQRFWPLPLVALLVTVILQTDQVGVDMPGWWPVIKSVVQPGFGEILQYMAVPVAAGLGYGDLALSSTPREKSIASAKALALYSIVLLGVAVAAEFYPLLTLPGVLLAPLGHELLIVRGNRRELTRRPLYRPEEEGAAVMMVIPGSPADQAGLRDGDRILKMNGMPVHGCRDLLEGLEQSYFMVLLEGRRNAEEDFSAVLKKQQPAGAPPVSLSRQPPPESRSPAYSALHRCAAQGLILAPSARMPVYVETRRTSPLRGLCRFLKGKP
ncbi:MAG: PDZ domain-containing protein [Bacillota bacterium]